MGAIYLRDGVCVLPEQESTLKAFLAIAGRIKTDGGRCTLVRGARLDPERALQVVSESRAKRTVEYDGIVQEASSFVDYLRQEREHRRLTSGEPDRLGADLVKLHRWVEQVRVRDYFGAEDRNRTEASLQACEAELTSLRKEMAR